MSDDNAMLWGSTASSDDKLWATIAHLSVYVATFIGPLLVLLVFGSKSKFVRYHAIQALVVQGVAVIASVIISVISVVTCGFGSVLYLPLLLMVFVPLWGAYLSWNGTWSGFPALESIGKD
jgi:uncharacterized membrane protein